MSLCECGCGEEVKKGNRFISGHNTRLRTSSERIEIGKKTSITCRITREIKEGKRPAPILKYCACGCGGIVSKPENTYIYRHGCKGIPKSDIHKKRISESKKGQKRSKEHCKKISEGYIKYYQEHPEAIEQRREKFSGDNNPMKRPELAAKASEFMKNNNPMKNPEYRKRVSVARKKNWQDPEFVRMMMDSFHTKPNKPEKLIYSLLQNILPDEYAINVKGHIVIDGKIPDFVNINGQKKLIEFNGCYFHNCPQCYPNNNIDGLIETEKRIKLFKKYGWSTLVIWEHELEDMKAVVNKILGFHDMKSLPCTKQLTID